MENQEENQNQENQNQGLVEEQIAANTEAERISAEEAARTPEPTPITDEVLFSEISKRYDKVKSKEDLEKYLSFDETQYIKPKSELVKKLNDWQGEPEQYLKIAKLDVEKLDNKSAIIQDMMIKEGVTEKIAELRFKQKFGDAFISDEEIEYDEERKDKKILAEYEFNKASVESKNNLSQWKASSEESGFRKPEPIDEAKRMEAFEKEWVKPVKQAVDSLQKLSIETKYQLPDKTEVSEPFNYLTENAKTKEIVADMLTSPNSDVFMQKFMKQFGVDESGKLNFSKLAEAVTFILEKDSIIGKAMAVGASKGLSNHLKEVKVGNLKDKVVSNNIEPQGFDAIKNAWNSAYQNKLNNK